MPGSQQRNGLPPESKKSGSAHSLEADIALLSNLLSQNVDESDPDVAELLRRLDAAEGIADGVESRLDGIMDHLDNLLSDLESKTAPQHGEGAVAHVEEEVVVVASGSQEAVEETPEK
ncbi:hypothetical protein C8Q77DRAFT_1069998 [Trametes polyzona]|nr:hypothetical protein C8Q77DRAFT_1069998 [Trametes polyzona]